MRSIFTLRFWVDAAERAIKSFAQGCLAAFGQDVGGVDLFAANLGNVAASGLGMAVLSILTSIVSAPAQGISPASIAPPGIG